MYYYTDHQHVFCSHLEGLPFRPLPALPEGSAVTYLFRRPPLQGRDAFAVSHPRLLTDREDVTTLTDACPEPPVDGALRAAIAEGRVSAVNLEHPRWQELLSPLLPAGKKRVHLLALGDVGSTLLTGLRLLGSDCIGSIGICDVRPGFAQRWAFEMNQIALPWDYDAMPAVEIVEPSELFRCDVFLFCASRFVPDTAVKTGDVRMAQYELNRELVASYARQARDARFSGLFCVVSDPVDPLCRAALLESNRDERGRMDYQGLTTRQVRGFGLGVMNARAAYYANQDSRFAAFLTEGRTFGPHGEGLVVADSIARYDDALSRELTEKTAHANLEMRALGIKPYVAPALSSGALSLLLLLRGAWHCSSVYLDGIFMGCKNRLTDAGVEIEQLPLPPALLARIRETAEQLRSIP